MTTKILLILISVLFAVSLVGCTKQYEEANKQAECTIASTRRYKLVRVNDSILVCMPTSMAESSMKPIVINLKNIK